MTIELRRVTAEDWATWRPVRLAALADAPDAFGSRLDDWRDAPEHRWRTRLSLPGAIDLLAVDTDSGDGRAIGMASGVPDADDPHRAELISMWVQPVARRRGVARLLIDAVADWAAECGSHELVLSVMPDNRDAQETYARTGFSVTDEPGDVLPDGRRELVVRRDLEERS
ncbi:GNAT family N-acetyltransferase [Curtobacterium sp. NPDC089689]|uniref:GNAT family N-acetyltransferase n=1 Tax=Curtobacterium sp. NPDC089689 TaxID=3363968 RepID=UPI00382E543D